MEKGEVTKVAAIAGVVAGAETLGLLTATRSYIHMGSRSHNSLGVNRATTRALDAMMTPYTDPSGWGATHIEGHHKLADANVMPFIEVADAMDWRDTHNHKGYHDPPESFDNLDYVAKDISLDTVREIGTVARELAAVGGYKPKQHYNKVEFAQAIDYWRPRYVYENMQERASRSTPSQWEHDKNITLDDVWFRLMDPHSPSLHPEGPKPYPFFRDMIPLMYRSVERNWDSNEQLPDYAHRDKRQNWHYEHRHQIVRGLTTAHFIGGAALGMVLGERRPAQILKNSLVGGAVIGLSGLGLIAGGTLTNYFGHLGADPIRAFKTGEITPNEDGSLATNGHISLSLATLDEAGWQGNHHEHPEWIDFGNGRPRQAPVGFIIKKLADKGLLGLGHGEGFNNSEHRPDELHDSVKFIQQERIRTLQNN
ncbi:hypothetical protein KC950_02970 [Candidatus Saccharibacteria bacterium]|nr:hypothetical protein [Candidatus Saccharibacteria bacterium]